MMERRTNERPKWLARAPSGGFALPAVAAAPEASGGDRRLRARATDTNQPAEYRAVLACSFRRADAPARRR